MDEDEDDDDNDVDEVCERAVELTEVACEDGWEGDLTEDAEEEEEDDDSKAPSTARHSMRKFSSNGSTDPKNEDAFLSRHDNNCD